MDFVIFTLKEYEQIKNMVEEQKREFLVPLNFGTRTVSVEIVDEKKVIVEKRFLLRLDYKLKENFCYRLTSKGVYPCAFYSHRTNKFYKLIPTKDWPSLAIGSVPMHKIKNSSPYEDTLRKIRLLKPSGMVLDTCMGLGYTAILASLKSEVVFTFEKDRNVVKMTKINPMSSALFERENIKVFLNDIAVYVKKFGEAFFDCIIHDPPTFKLAPELYREEFYQQLYRVLKKGGRFYHYLPYWGIKRGKDFPSKIKERVERIGFKVIKFLPQTQDLLCLKK